MKYGIIRHYGEVKTATVANNRRVERVENMFIPEYMGFVACAPYDDHFVYANNIVGQSSYMCTCGSVAVIVPPSPNGMMVCHFHATYGKHQTSFVNKDNFEAVAEAGEVLRVKGRRELI